MRRIPNSQLKKLVRSLAPVNRLDSHIPVMISTIEGGCALGRLLDRGGARVSAVLNIALEQERAVTVFMPENAYMAEVTKCVAQGSNTRSNWI